MEPNQLVNFTTLKEQASSTEPLELYIVGASVSQSEKRFVQQYHGNDYFNSLQIMFSKPINIKDVSGIASMVNQLAILMGVATKVNRKCQVRDGIKPMVGPDITTEFSCQDNRITDGLIAPGQETKALMAQLQALRLKVDTGVAELDSTESTPAKPATVTKKASVRQSKPTSTPTTEVN